jgi:hypothetical protein
MNIMEAGKWNIEGLASVKGLLAVSSLGRRAEGQEGAELILF